MRDVTPVRPVAPWVGGKRQLAKKLTTKIDAIEHAAYIEVFGGMGGVFFRRRRAPKIEVINDLNRDVATFFRVLQNHYEALMDMLRWQLTSRAEFDRLNGMDPDRLTDLQRAARFLYLQRTAFGGKVAGRSFGIATTTSARFDVTKLAETLATAHERLAGVWIECLPWQALIERWDRPGTLFYLDPPYIGSEHYYGRDMFRRDEYGALAASLRTLRGAFIMSLNDHPEARAIFAGFSIETTEVTYEVGGRSKPAREIIIGPPA
jgi:DNA adenine methylase